MRLYYRFMRGVARTGGLLLCRLRVLGRENVPLTGPVVLACNHQSFFDPMLATLSLDRECSYMARDSLFRSKWGRRIIESLNAYPIKRGTADVGAVKETLRRLKAGELITAFPEGTRTVDGRIGRLEPGLAAIARKSGATVVPTIIEGAYECWPRTSKFPRPAQVWVEHGRAWRPGDYAGMNSEAFTAVLQEQLWRMHNALRVRYNRRPFDYPTTEAGRDS